MQQLDPKFPWPGKEQNPLTDNDIVAANAVYIFAS